MNLKQLNKLYYVLLFSGIGVAVASGILSYTYDPDIWSLMLIGSALCFSAYPVARRMRIRIEKGEIQ